MPRIIIILRAVLGLLISSIPDLLVIVGGLLAAFGIWQIFRPAAWIWLGSIFIVAGLALAIVRARAQARAEAQAAAAAGNGRDE